MPRIVIVGGGAAGLSCAASLVQDHGMQAEDILILEARQRLGGRIQTIEQPVNETRSVQLDVGAAWIHGVHETNPVTELVADSRCIGSANPWTEPAIELLGLYQSGERLDDRWVQQGIEAHHARMVAVKSEVSRRYEAGDGLHLRDDVSLQQLADAIPLDVPQEVRFGAQMCLELLGCWMGASTTLLQGAEFDYEVGERLGDFPGPHALPVGGMQQVITSLLDKIPGVPVKLNSEVDHIEWGGTGVEIHTSGVEQPISADICVCTLPIGVLKDAISRNDKPLFEPSLPLAKQEAIKRIGISGYTKVLLICREVCWPTDKPFLCCSSHEYGVVLFDNLWASDGLPIIEAVFVAPEQINSEESLRRATQAAADCWGSEVLNAHVTSWGEDPYAYGAYSYFTLGTHCSDPSVLGEPCGQNLLWAGEATDDEYQGAVYAAILSGRRAAEEAILRLDH